MQKHYLLIGCLTVLLLYPLSVSARNRILYIDSYHQGYEWSDGITEGIRSVLDGKDVELRIIRMDTKRNDSEAFKKKAALLARAEIQSFQPDVVIASDDNASKYLIKPYYKDAKLPFIFCGVNRSGDKYGYPYSNVTGMVEVSPMPKLFYSLKHFNRAEKVAYLAGDGITDKIDGADYGVAIDLPYTEYYVKDFEQWKYKYTLLQEKYDLVIIGNNASISGWDNEAALNVVTSRTKKPTGCVLDWLAPYSFLGYTKVPQEQGRWSAKTALAVLDGKSISDIPITKNVEGKLIINMNVAKAMGVNISKNFMRKASRIIQ